MVVECHVGMESYKKISSRCLALSFILLVKFSVYLGGVVYPILGVVYTVLKIKVQPIFGPSANIFFFFSS